MRLNDTLCGLLILLFGAGIILHTGTFPAMPGQNVGPALFPRLIGIGLVLAGLTLTGSGFRVDRTPRLTLDDWVRRPRTLVDVALVIGATVFYVMIVDTAGFFLTGPVFLAILFLTFGVRRRWVLPLAAGVTLVLHVGFYTLLHVPLPWGWLEGIAW